MRYKKALERISFIGINSYEKSRMKNAENMNTFEFDLMDEFWMSACTTLMHEMTTILRLAKDVHWSVWLKAMLCTGLFKKLNEYDGRIIDECLQERLERIAILSIQAQDIIEPVSYGEKCDKPKFSKV